MDAKANPIEAAPLTHRQTRQIVFGVLLPLFLGSLDNTILASALPTIGRDFGEVHSLPWLITIYLLASTACMPLYGKVADIHGRQFALRIAIAAYLAGSLICALAPSMLVLILGRALQGIGGSGLSSISVIVLGDIAAPKERGRYYAYFSITYTTAGACGPALGGFIADHLHWSAIFWLNIPLGLLSLWITSSLLSRLPRHERPHHLDVIGAILIVLASVAFMLALNLGGRSFAWLSLPVVLLFVAALVVGAFFVMRLVTAPEPLIPIAILVDPVVRWAVIANALGWGSIIGLNIFLPMYLQSVIGLSPTNAGLSLMVLMVSLNSAAGLSGQLLGRVKHYKILPMCMMAIALGSITTLAWRTASMTPIEFEIILFLLGVGFGPMPAVTAVALQNAVARHQLGIAIGTMNFVRSLFSTILVALLGVIVLAVTSALAPGGGV
jgi:EmrB/QacA subfamily drug resistance transporter